MPLDDYSKPAPRSPSPQSKLEAGISALRRKLGELAEVRSPASSEEPILAPNIRMSVYHWLHEIRAEKELERANVKPRRTALLVGPAGTERPRSHITYQRDLVFLWSLLARRRYWTPFTEDQNATWGCCLPP
jgi:hypothetical protein